MPTELEYTASEAWRAMHNDVHPMPPGVALDMVQDVSGDRDDTVSAILAAAASRLESLIPADPTFRPEAEPACRSIAAEDFRFAETLVNSVRVRARPMLAGFLAEEGAAWLRWCAYAERDLALCRAACAAAYPPPVSRG